MWGIPTMLVTECAWLVLAGPPDASKRIQKQSPKLSVTFKWQGTLTLIIRGLPQSSCVPTSVGAQKQPFFSHLALFEVYFSSMCTLSVRFPPVLPLSYLRNPNSYPTFLFLCDSQSQQNFTLSFNCVACLNPQIELQIVYSLKKFQKWPGI